MAEHLKTGWPQRVERQQEVMDTVSRILSEVERDGLPAIRRWSRQLDGWDPESFVVSADRIKVAAETVDEELAAHLEFARSQVERFARAQRETLTDLEVETLPGVVLGHRHVPVAKVGSYSPGGRYPLIASSIMTVTVPKVAGVDTVVAVAPPRDGHGIYGPQLYTMNLAGADVIVCLGGVQAFAAMAFGIEDVAPVDLVVGAGNAYVAEAKRQLFGTVGIDLLAGPTEVAVIADESADPRLVAADLLGQAEHGFNSPALLVTTSRSFGTAVISEVNRWLAGDWPTVEVAGGAWREHGTVVVCESREEAVQVSDAYAPEHLEVQTADDDWYAANLRNYGSLFIGPQATVAFSDKSIGTNHVLPTGRAGRYTGGLWVGKFLKTVTYQRLTAAGARSIAPSTAAIADAELMFGHALTARLRMD
ncbi:sulfopropanediol 3-dehydrogenase [Kribbella sp. VKM Ac-2571]|uniref:histidinol dehydrogenase n=1 Tax=Kribbella sp. VKM Ac-2571 TaxID=2512222 RepID=UPI00105F4F28|nr:histidinol dehydrogenase [Kribbella sp. VKM Ac-2571]TDO69501.1 sulfopropanediol 3-dehydrogenase [Kribbella sp. VKM Ac-2571]